MFDFQPLFLLFEGADHRLNEAGEGIVLLWTQTNYLGQLGRDIYLEFCFFDGTDYLFPLLIGVRKDYDTVCLLMGSNEGVYLKWVLCMSV